MARQVPFSTSDSSGFYGGAKTVPIIVDGKTALTTTNPYKKKKKQQPTGDSAAATVEKNPPKKGGKGGKGGKDHPAVEPYNPLTAPFKTPAELRAEAAQLAAMGVGDEASLRAQQARQEAGISGLTTALSNRLQGLSNEYGAGLRGLTTQYGQLASQAQAAGESAAAAAGAPTSIAPGASPTVATTMAALNAVPATYAPAAEMRGAMLRGATYDALTKALTDRATKLSADTAKYLYQLKQDEIQRAISQGTLAQNQARLNLTGQNQAWNQQVDAARLQQGSQRIALQQQRLAQSIVSADAKSAKSAQQKIQGAKDRILNNKSKWLSVDDPSSYEWTVPYMLNGQTYTVTSTGASEQEARDKVVSGLSPDQQKLFTSGTASWLAGTRGNAASRPATPQEIIGLLVPILVNKGMKRANAVAWVNANIIPAQSSGGTFRGGVSGSGV